MRFLWLLAALGLLAASTYLACVFGAASYAEVARLGHIVYYEYNPVEGARLALPLAAMPRFAPAPGCYLAAACWLR